MTHSVFCLFDLHEREKVGVGEEMTIYNHYNISDFLLHNTKCNID